VVISKTRQILLRKVFGSSLAGDGMLVRLRSTSIALLGVVTAIGLGLVAFISQLGWPGIVNSPIPSGPAEAGAVHNAVALTQGPATASIAPRRAVRPAAIVPSGGHAATPTTGSGRDGSRHQVDVAAVGQQPATVGQPQPAAAPTRTVEPQTTSSVPSLPPAPATAVVETPQAGVATPTEGPKAVNPKPGGPTTTGVDGNGEEGKADEGERKPEDGEESKSDDEESKGDTPSPGPKHGEGGRDRGQSGPSKPADHHSGKPDASGASAPVVAAPPSTPPAKAAPEAGSPGFDKEAWDAGRSDKRHH
jgi:hypothetical protein